MDLNHAFVTLVFVTCVFKFLIWAWFRPKKLDKLLREQGLSGNPYRLVVGDAIEFMSVVKDEQRKSIKFSDDLPYHIMPYFKQTIQKYGDNSFIWLGPSPTLLVTDPYMIKEILTKPDIYRKPVPDTIGETLAGGILYLYGDKWAKHRKIMNPAFRIENLMNMTSAIRLSCSNMIDKWQNEVSKTGESKTEIDVWSYVHDLAGDMISRIVFGSNHDQGKVIFDLQNQQMKLVLEYLPYYFVPGFRYLPTKSSKKFKFNCKKIKSVLTSVISKRQNEIGNGETTSNDLLDMLMGSDCKETGRNVDKNSRMSTDDIIEECKLFYFAGSDTTSALIVWTMVLLGKHKEWQDRARDEVTMILQEVLRLYPPGPIMTRAPLKTSELGKMTIPIGTNLFLLTGLLHHDPRIWGDDVEEFKPERFYKGTSLAMKVPFSFIPFSGGPRICIGQHLAMVQAKITLAMILQRFTFELSPSYQHAPFTILSLQPKYGVPLLFENVTCS